MQWIATYWPLLEAPLLAAACTFGVLAARLSKRDGERAGDE